MSATKNIIIIGGGISGLAAANRLADLGVEATLIEAGEYPQHKVCGEFYSPECVSILDEWEIPTPVSINETHFISENKILKYNFPNQARGVSRFECDYALMQRAQRKGIQFLTGTTVQKIKSNYTLTLSNGKTLNTEQLILATGRRSTLAESHWNHSTKTKTPFVGIKAHFEGLDLKHRLEMYSLPGAYLGMSQIEGHKTNVAMLAKTDCVQAAGGADKFVEQLLEQKQSKKLKERLKPGKRLFKKWLTCGVPKFGNRSVASWPSAYLIGDANGAITPVCGDGIGMGLTSGIMAADYALQKKSDSFQLDWERRYQKRLNWGALLQGIMLEPTFAQLLIKTAHTFPKITDLFFKKTRE